MIPSTSWLGLLSVGSALVGFGNKQLLHLLVWVSPWTLCSSHCPFDVWQRRCGTQPEYSLLLVSRLGEHSVSVQSNRSRTFFLDSALSVGVSSSFSFISFSSLRFLVYIGVWPSFWPEFSGVRYQNAVFCCCVLIVLKCSFRYAVRIGSPSGIILRIAITTGLMNLDRSGVTTDNSAFVCPLWSCEVIPLC